VSECTICANQAHIPYTDNWCNGGTIYAVLPEANSVNVQLWSDRF
jgi:hypothetical protein